MDYIKDSDFLIEVAKGNIAKHTLVTILGRNQDVDTSIVDIGMEDENFTWLTSPTAIEAISDDASDTILGSGARTITINGLDANFDTVSEIIEMNGTSVTLSGGSPVSFIRINKTLLLTQEHTLALLEEQTMVI